MCVSFEGRDCTGYEGVGGRTPGPGCIPKYTRASARFTVLGYGSGALGVSVGGTVGEANKVV